MSQPEYGSSQGGGSGGSSGQVFGDYALVEQLSESKTGTVWKAQHRVTGGTVALKMLSRAAIQSNTMIERFRRQVQIMAELRHPNLVNAYEGGRLEGVPYLVMEYIEGQDLRTLVKRRGPFSVQEAVEYVIQAAAGLACAHARGIWHRNVKPGNLMVDRSGMIRVTGFGLAHVEASEDEGNVALTIQGQAMGTGDYMAPEQTLDARSVDARADVYSLGCTLCMLLTGKPPYKATSWEQMVGAHLTAPIPSLSAARRDVPPALDAVFQKMLAKRADDRYGSMEEVIGALRGAMATAAPPAPHAPAWPNLQGPAMPAAPRPDLSDIPLPDLPGLGLPPLVTPGPQSPATPAGAWPAPLPDTYPLAPSPGLQTPAAPTSAWPDLPPAPLPGPQAPAVPTSAWPDLPQATWPDPMAGAMPAGPSPDFRAPPVEAGPLDASYLKMVRPEPKIPRWVLSVAGYIVSAIVGLCLAYFLIKALVPGSHLPW
jgi:serine/threonine protein kinase